MDHLKEVLTETIRITCQQTLAYSSSLQFDALLGLTVDRKTTLVFNLSFASGTESKVNIKSPVSLIICKSCCDINYVGLFGCHFWTYFYTYFTLST